MGSPEMDVARNIELVRATGCAILSVDYRLAPEHPHPAGLEDCHAALVWFAAQAEGAADFAGAHWRDRRKRGRRARRGAGAAGAGPAVRCRWRVRCWIYPMLMPPAQSLDATAPRCAYGALYLDSGVEWLLLVGFSAGRRAERQRRLPGLRRMFPGLPPTFIAVGELDLFVQDDLAYASRLLAAGCSVEAHVYPGAVHGFDRMVDAAVSAALYA